MGDALASIMSDTHMPSIRAFYNWCRNDDALNDEYRWAQALGQRTLKDFTYDIAMGGIYNTGDVRRDELLIKVMDKNASQRNRAEFGYRVQAIMPASW